MAEDYSILRGWVARALASYSKTPDGAQSAKNGLRMGSYGEQYTLSPVPPKHLLAEEGSYFVTTNPTMGTGVAQALVTGFAATSGLFAIYNGNPTGGKNVYLDYLRLILTGTAPATCTAQDFAIVIDSASRLPSAGNAARVPQNVNSGDSTAAGAIVHAFSGAALTVPAAGVAARTVGRVRIATGQVISGDEMVIEFGSTNTPAGQGGGAAVRATDIARRVANAPPVVIAPGHWCVIHRWFTTETTNAPNFEYELAHWER